MNDTPTVDDFRTRFGEFSNPANFKSEDIQRAQELAARYAKNDALIHLYATAHLLLTVVMPEKSGNPNPADDSAGRKTLITRGPQMVQFEVRTTEEGANHWTDPHWDKTSYGAEARRLAEAHTAGMGSVVFIR